MAKALDRFKDDLSKIAKDVGVDVARGSESSDADLEEPVGTGIDGLDFILGGGLFFGRMYEIFGEEAAGKSTLTYHMMTKFQQSYQENGVLFLVESESAIDKNRAQLIGVDLENLLQSEPEAFEDAVNLITRSVSKMSDADPNLRMMIDWDTITVTPTRNEIDNTTKGKFIGSGISEKPRLLSFWLRTATKFFAQHKVIVLFVSQVRDKIGQYGGGIDSTGGHAMKHYATVRMMVRRGAGIIQEDKLVGHKVKISLEKSKQSPPHNYIEVDHYFNSGFDGISSIAWFGKHHGIFNVKSNGFTNIPGIDKSYRSSAAVIEELRTDRDLYHYVTSLCYQYMYRSYPTLSRLIKLEQLHLSKSGKYSQLNTVLVVSTVGGVLQNKTLVTNTEVTTEDTQDPEFD